MTQKNVIDIIRKTCPKKAEFLIIESQSTESVYCKVKVGLVGTTFRISDHKAAKKNRNIRTLVWGKSTTKEHIERFVKNTVRNLEGKSIHIAMDNLSRRQVLN